MPLNSANERLSCNSNLKFAFRVDEVLPPGEPLWDVNCEFYDSVLHAPRAMVKFTMMSGFVNLPILMPQMRIAIGDLEGRPVHLNYDSEQRSGSYTVRGSSKHFAGSVVAGEITTQLNPATTKDEIIAQLSENPAGLMIEMYGHCGWISPDCRAEGESILVRGHDEDSEYVPTLCMVAELLREGRLEIDGEGVVKLKGYAFVPAKGSFFYDGIIGEDLSLNDCYDLIDGWGLHGLQLPSEKPDWNSLREKVEKFLEFDSHLSILRNSTSDGIPS
jgi:hypothetical protein